MLVKSKSCNKRRKSISILSGMKLNKLKIVPYQNISIYIFWVETSISPLVWLSSYTGTFFKNQE